MKYKLITVFLITFSYGISVLAEEKSATITPLTWADQQDMNNKLFYINEIARTRLGTEIHGDTTDIETLQRIADGKFLDKTDKERLQSTGVVLGNLLKNELERLEWVVYEDSDGRSRALCVEKSSQCLFPTTMISRRLEVDAPVNVQSIYDNAYALIKPHVEASHPYQPSKLVRPEYKPPPKEDNKPVSVKFE